MQFRLVFIFLVTCFVLKAQTNLVRNNSFEDGNPQGSYSGSSPDRDDFDNDLDWWQVARTGPVSPDYYDINSAPPSIAINPPVPSNRFVFMGNLPGTFPAGNDGEGIRSQIRERLKGDKYYTVRMKIYSTNLNSKIRVHFTEKGLRWKQEGSGNTKIANAAIFTLGANDLNRWITFEQTFFVEPSKDGKLGNIIITIHDLTNPAMNSGSGYIDDVFLFESGLECPEIMLIENKNYIIDEPVFKASKIIKAGFDVGNPEPNGNVVVQSNANITYEAGESVILEPGFIAEFGSEFIAQIVPCSTLCEPPLVDAGQDFTNCNIDFPWPLQIGSSPQPETKYSWSAIPTSGTQYLSNSNISNPVFTPPLNMPPGSFIQYILTAQVDKPLCDAIATDAIIIQYEPTNGKPNVLGIPNAFTPNGDGLNDVWVVFVENASRFEADIRDRFGDKTLTSGEVSGNRAVIWDGLTNGKDPNIGVHTFTITFYGCDNSFITKVGSVSVLSNSSSVQSINSNIVQGEAITGSSYFEETTSFIIDSSNLKKEEPTAIQFKAIPNPNSGSFFITSDNNESITRIEVYNSFGELVFVKTNLNKKSVSIHKNFTSGMYFVKVWSGEQSSYVKVLVN